MNQDQLDELCDANIAVHDALHDLSVELEATFERFDRADLTDPDAGQAVQRGVEAMAGKLGTVWREAAELKQVSDPIRAARRYWKRRIAELTLPWDHRKP